MGSVMPPDFDPHKFTRPFQLTQTIHRDPYFDISADNPANSKKGQIIVITGGGTGIGAVSFTPFFLEKLNFCCNMLSDVNIGYRLQQTSGAVRVLWES